MSNVTCTSIGDVLRVLDKKHLIRNDFVLLSGDVLGNIRLDEAISLHKRLRSSDKSFIITKVFKELPERSRLRS